MAAIAKPQRWYEPAISPGDEDAKVDEALLESFPASDAPPWTLGVSHPRVSDVLDVSRPPSREGFGWAVLQWVEAAGVVLVAVLMMIALGTAVVLVVRLIVEAVSWLIGRIW
jgi:hypothetical protein